MILQQKDARKGHAKPRAKILPRLEHLELREVLDAALLFDFGTAASPLAANFTRVTEASKFDSAKGYGWLSGNVDSRDRGSLDSLNSDFNFSPNATFGVNLANGTYSVSLTMGDDATLHDQDIYLQGNKVDSITARTGQFVTRTYTVGVSDGRLSLRLYGLGGLDDNAVVNSIVITPSATTPPPSGMLYDFGTATSPVSANYTRVTEATKFDAARGYGWISTNVDSRDRGGSDAATRDFNFGPDVTYGVNLASGRYSVTLVIGDSATVHDQDIYLEGRKVDSVTARAGQFVTRTYTVDVGDGQLNLRLYGVGGLDDNAVLNSLSIAGAGTVPPAPIAATFGNGGAVNEGSTGSVSFSGVSGGAGGYSYSYDFDNDGTFEVSNSSSATAVVPSSFLADGPSARVVRGVVKDSAGATASYTTSLQVNNVAPTATIANVSAGVVAGNFGFGGSATDPSSRDQASLAFAWDFGDGATATGQSTSHTYTRAGNYTVRLTVSDKDGGSGFATTIVTVAAPAPAPISATFGNGGAVNEGSTGSVSFSGVSGGAGGYSYSYDFNNDGTFEISNSASQTAVVPSSFLADGPSARVVRGMVRDSAGANASFTTSLQVNNVAPTPTFTGPGSGVAGTALAFTGSATDPGSLDQASLAYAWDFGDGGTATGQSASHAFASAGTYTVRLAATDKDGGRGTATSTVTITAVPAPPPPGDGILRQYDFGTATSPVTPGYTRTTLNSVYSAAAGFGWTESPDGGERDRETGSDLVRDLIISELPMTFRVDVPNGEYTVRLISGDTILHDGEMVYLQGTRVDTIDTRANEWIAREYPVTVTNGSISLRMVDSHKALGTGVDFYSVINGLQVYSRGMNVAPPELPPPPPPPAPPPVPPETITNQLVFGPQNTPVPAGYTLIPYTTTYTDARGFGYEGNGLVRDVDRGAGADEVRYFATAADATFRINVTPGVYTVTLVMGDQNQQHEQDTYFAYHRVDHIVTPANTAVTRTYTVNVYDGHLRVQFIGLGPDSPDESATLHSLTYQLTSTTLPPQPYSQRYDFGNNHLDPVNFPSPVGDGYNRVDVATTYTPGGFGWVPGSQVDDRDIGHAFDYYLSNAITRDYNISSDATFKAAVPNGTYNVTLIFGDIDSAHEQNIYLQGALVTTYRVEAREYAFLTYTVTVTDGVFTFRMQETADPNTNYALISAIDIVRAS